MAGIYRKIEMPGAIPNPTGNQPTLRLLFIGGCHAVGYFYGFEHGFPQVAMEQLQLRHPGLLLEGHVLAYVPLSHTAELMARCQEVRPDILVLQLGHYETESAIKRRVRTLLHLPQPPRHKSTSVPASNSVPSQSSSSESSSKSKSNGGGTIGLSRWPTPTRVVKYWLDLALCAAGLPSVNLPKIRSHSRELFSQIAAAGIPHVVVMSPFLTMPAQTNRYRRSVGRVLREEATAAGFPYLHLDDIFGSSLSHRRYELHCDDLHLGPLGQQAVAERLAAALEQFAPLRPPSAVPRKATADEGITLAG